MNRSLFSIKIIFVFFIIFNFVSFGQGLIIDHNCADLNSIPLEWIDSAKVKLHIAYQHTSHGSQLSSGMEGLQNWKGEPYTFSNGGSNGELDFHDYAMSGYGASDLGNPNRTAWASATSEFLKNQNNNDVNVVIWSWCGQVSSADSADIQLYLDLMTSLEDSFPKVKFIYMTGHLDGTGIEGNLHQRNEQIRRYCRINNKILFDFADIESYDPDGVFYLDKYANDNCDYDSDGNGSRDKNWAEEWQNSHAENIDWYSCSAAHSKALNGNRKAYAAWYLWASLAGWNPALSVDRFKPAVRQFRLNQNFPNPFNPSTVISWYLYFRSSVTLKVFDILGNEIATLVNEEKQAGAYEVEFSTEAGSASGKNASKLSSGIYFYRITAGSFSETKKMILIR